MYRAKLTSAILVCFTVFLAVPAAFAVEPYYSILQGSTSQNETHFTVVSRVQDKLTFEIAPEDDREAQKPASRLDTYPGSSWGVYHLYAKNLDSKTSYTLRVFDSAGNLADERIFRTLDSAKKNPRVGVGSCMLRQLHNAGLWDTLYSKPNRPDLLLLLGDTNYLDRDNLFWAEPPRSALQAWNSFAYSRNTLNLYFYKELVPTLSIWDDHDAGGDNVTPVNFKLMPEIRKVFDSYFSNDEIPGWVERGPGLAKQLKVFGQNIILTDGRSFRDLEPSSPQFGAEQERWILERLTPGLNFLASATPFFGKYIEKDSYEFNAPNAFFNFIDELKIRSGELQSKIVFLSGDTHFSEIQKIEPDYLGYGTLEITSSSIHSMGMAGHQYLKPFNPRRVTSTGSHNFVLLEFGSPEVRVRSIVSGGEEKFNIGFSCEELLL